MPKGGNFFENFFTEFNPARDMGPAGILHGIKNTIFGTLGTGIMVPLIIGGAILLVIVLKSGAHRQIVMAVPQARALRAATALR